MKTITAEKVRPGQSGVQPGPKDDSKGLQLNYLTCVLASILAGSQPEPPGRIQPGRADIICVKSIKTAPRANSEAHQGNYVIPRPLNLVGREFRQRWLSENVRYGWSDWFGPVALLETEVLRHG